MPRDLVRYFLVVFERGCDARVEKKVGSQPPPAYCHARHILFYYIEDCSSFKRIMNPFLTSHLIPSSYFNSPMEWDYVRAINPYIKGIESLHQSAVAYIKSLHQNVKVPDFY